MSQDIIEQLKLLKKTHEGMNPSPEWIETNREKLFSQIKNSVGSTPEPISFFASFESFMKFFISAKVYYSLRVAFVFFLAIGITVGGWIGGVSASHKCLPGEFCYNVKLAAEKTQVAVASVTGNTDKQVALHLEFASRRLEEIRQVNTEFKSEAVKQLTKSVTSVGETLQEVKEDDPQKAAAVAKDITKKTSDMARSLNDVSQGGIVEADTVKDIADATQAINNTGIQALQVALEGQMVGQSSDDLKALVVEKIDLILDDSKGAQTTAHEAKQNFDDAVASTTLALSSTTLPLSINGLISTTTLPLVTSTTLLPTTTPLTSQELNNLVAKVDKTVTEAQVVADEAKALLIGNKVGEAIEKVKTLNTLVGESKQTTADAAVPLFTASSTLPENFGVTTTP